MGVSVYHCFFVDFCWLPLVAARLERKSFLFFFSEKTKRLGAEGGNSCPKNDKSDFDFCFIHIQNFVHHFFQQFGIIGLVGAKSFAF